MLREAPSSQQNLRVSQPVAVAQCGVRVLFVCSRNRQRSLTAQRVFGRIEGLQVQSAGTEPSARIRVTARQLRWADVVFVMERRHLTRLRQRFRVEVQNLLDDGALEVLDIPDIYPFMDEELVLTLEQLVKPLLDQWESP